MNKRIAILGAGESGVGAALLAKAKGSPPFVSDNGKIKPEYKSELLINGIAHEEGKHSEKLLFNADEVIKSPGIPDDSEIIRKLKEKDIPVISEIEFAARYTNARIIAITGTNGKSTTTYLTYHLMKEAGLNVCMAGNVGNSFAREVLKNFHDYYVLEISSFQLDGMFDFKADTAILLNITPDHLDRYQHNMNLYTESKFRISRNMGPNDAFIYFEDDPVIGKYLEKHVSAATGIPVSLHEMNRPGVYFGDNKLHFNTNLPDIPKFSVDTGLLPVRGPHNMVNAMCSILAARIAGVDEMNIRAGLKSFINFPHRMEKIATINQVTFINDSKATNVDAVKYALDSFNNPIIWIAGGIDKGNDYSLIRDLVKKNVKGIVCLGKDNTKIIESFKNDVEIIADTDDLKKAIKKAYQHAAPGDVILLSPACASFDLFKNYMDRGEKFRHGVMDLEEKMLKEINS